MLAEGSWSTIDRELDFKRGIKTYPLPKQGVYLLTKEELSALYRAAEGESKSSVSPLVSFATYSEGESTPCRANINKMFGMHCAVLGSTGSGKSGTVAAILHSVLEHQHEGKNLSPQIIIIDPHGEYGEAFSERATVFRAYGSQSNEQFTPSNIQLPYWLMSSEEFASLVIGKTERSATRQNNVIYKAISHARMVAAGILKPSPTRFGGEISEGQLSHEDPEFEDDFDTSDMMEFDRDKPRQFSLDELENHIKFIQGGRLKKGTRELESQTATELGDSPIPSTLDKLKVLRRDPRISFLMNNWTIADPGLKLHEVINQLIGAPNEINKDIRIIDISGLPNEVAGPLTAMIARLLFQYKVHQTQEEKSKDPILLVCEEAHRYVPDHGEAQYAAAQTAIRRIAREGRKYGIGLMLVSQRPADVDSTVISQCGTWVVLRLTNAADQHHVARFLPDGLSGMIDALPVLAQQEAIFVGEGAALPARIRVRTLETAKLPRSNTIPFANGWIEQRLGLDEIEIISARMAPRIRSAII